MLFLVRALLLSLRFLLLVLLLFPLLLQRQQPRRQLPQRPHMGLARQIITISQQPRQHALHIRIKNRYPLSKTKSSNSRSSRWANTRQSLQSSRCGWKHTAIHIAHHLRTAMQIARAAVITQATPQRQHCILLCISQSQHIRKLLQKSLVIRNYRTHLRLLQHDFRKPNPIRLTRLLPRQMVATMHKLPVNQQRSKIKRLCCCLTQIAPKQITHKPFALAVHPQQISRQSPLMR